MRLIDDLTVVRENLVELLSPLSNEQLNPKLNEDTWSIVQVCRHLIFIDEMIYPALIKAMERERNVVEEKNMDFVKDRSRKLKSPYPDPTTEFITKEELLDTLNNVRNPLLNYLQNTTEQELVEKTMLHPLLGTIQIKQMLEFIVLHDQRHIEQIQELIQSTKAVS